MRFQLLNNKKQATHLSLDSSNSGKRLSSLPRESIRKIVNILNIAKTISWNPHTKLNQRLWGHIMSATPIATYGKDNRQLPKNPVIFQHWMQSELSLWELKSFFIFHEIISKLKNMIIREFIREWKREKSKPITVLEMSKRKLWK